MMNPIGLIAGNGQFPFLVAEEAKRQGHPVVAIAFPEETDPQLEHRVDRFHWVALGQVKKALSLLQQEGVKEAVMAGQVKHTQLFRNLKLDTTALKLLMSLRNKKTDTVLSAIANEFTKAGITLLSSTVYLQHLLAPVGPLGTKHPDGEQKKDIKFGFNTAKEIAGLDLGQTVCVKNQTVLAVEAMEGTDSCIDRAGGLCKGGFTVVKVAKPRQDVRFDVPVVGLQSLASLQAAQAAVLAIEAEKTLIFDKPRFIEKINEMGLVVVGVKSSNEDFD